MTSRARRNRQERLQRVDVRVLEGLAVHGPRNRSKLAANLGIPLGTLRYRINYLRSNFSLRLPGSLYHTHIGLRKVVVFAESKSGYEDLLYQCLKSDDYWLYVSQCIGNSTCLAIYGIPTGKEKQFEDFLGMLRELDQMQSVSFFWSTCFQNVNVRDVWFDNASEEWVFPWDSWFHEVQNGETELPYTLKDPEGYPQKADWIDIIILKELEKNCAVKLKEISRKLGMSLQRVKYHFENHVLKEKMYEGHQVFADHYKGLNTETCYFRFVFRNYGMFAKFANSLLNKPFVRVMGKAYRKNELFVQVYLPRQELRGFIDTLSKLVRGGLLETYEYVIQDLAKTERQTISYEFFKDNQWEYDHGKYAEKLGSTVKSFAAGE